MSVGSSAVNTRPQLFDVYEDNRLSMNDVTVDRLMSSSSPSSASAAVAMVTNGVV